MVEFELTQIKKEVKVADKIIGTALSVRWPLPTGSAATSVKDTILEVLKLVRKQYNRSDISIQLVLVTDRALDGLSFFEANREVCLNAYSSSLMPDGYMEILFLLPKEKAS